MMGWLMRSIGGVLRNASTHRHPSAMALAFAFGLAIGLIPKDNLFALGLAAVMCFFRINHLLAIALIVVVSFGATWTDGTASKLGEWILERPRLQPMFHEIATWPVLPWFRWNNSVVIGGFMAGMASFVPVYIFCMMTTRRVVRYQTQSRVDAIVSEIKHYHVQVRADQRKRQILDSDKPTEDRHRTIKKRHAKQHRIDDSPSTEVVKPNVIDVRPEPAMATMSPEFSTPGSSAVLQETVIEIVRYRPKGLTRSNRAEALSPSEATLAAPAVPNPSQVSATSVLDMPNTDVDSSLRNDLNIASQNNVAEEKTMLLPIAEHTAIEKPREEALRYLLWHLSSGNRQTRQQERVS